MPDPALREVMRLQNGKFPLLEKHIDRLRSGGCSDEVIKSLRNALDHTASDWQLDYAKVTVSVTTDDTIATTAQFVKSTILVEGNPVAEIVESDIPTLPPGAAKPDNRYLWDQALAKAKMKGAHIAIMVDHEGHIIDGSQATVWLRFGDTLVTPPAPPALAGVSREVIMEHADEFGHKVEEREVTVDEYEKADEVFVSTALGGVAPIRGREGEAAQTYKALFDEIFGITE